MGTAFGGSEGFGDFLGVKLAWSTPDRVGTYKLGLLGQLLQLGQLLFLAVLAFFAHGFFLWTKLAPSTKKRYR